MQIIANGAHHHLTGVEPDTDLHRHALRAPHLLRIALHEFLHGERRITGPDSMIVMRDRRAKQGHNAITHDLVHGPFIAVHGRHHVLEHRVEELARLLRVAVGQQLHRAFEVGKQDRDLLALAFQRATGREDFLREIGWGVAKGCRGSTGTAAGGRERSQPRRSRPTPSPCSSSRPAVGVEEFVLEILSASSSS